MVWSPGFSRCGPPEGRTPNDRRCATTDGGAAVSVVLILILASLAMALLFLGCFIWAVRSGQFEDTCTPSMRILTDEAASEKQISGTESKSQFK